MSFRPGFDSEPTEMRKGDSKGTRPPNGCTEHHVLINGLCASFKLLNGSPMASRFFANGSHPLQSKDNVVCLSLL